MRYYKLYKYIIIIIKKRYILNNIMRYYKLYKYIIIIIKITKIIKLDNKYN